MDASYIFLILAVLFGIIELFFGTFVFIGLSIALVLAGAAEYLEIFPDPYSSPATASLFVSIMWVLMVLVLRRIWAKYGVKSSAPDPNE